MICPACKGEMVIIEELGIELDYCPACKGIWFDKGEVELLLEKTVGDGLFDNLEKRSKDAKGVEKERRLRCPRCSRKMKKLLVEYEGDKVVIDSCPVGDGLWFDKGEAFRVMRGLAQGRDVDLGRLSSFLSIFG
jgi:Zn-finger nucleic acid-binding protein